MARFALLALLLWAPFALAQVESDPPTETPTTSGEVLQVEDPAPIPQAPEPEATDPADTDFIGRLNDAIDKRVNTAESGEPPPFSDATTSNAMISMWRGVFALCIVIALILIVYYGLRKWGKKVPLLAGANLASVLGRIHLERGTTLHFLRTGGRVLIVGVNANAVSLVADFDASAFESHSEDSEGTSEPAAPFNPDGFLAQLQASSQAMAPRPETDEVPVDDDEIAALRGDIQRLQRYLREESRESQD